MEQEISSAEARDQHGVTSRHGRMPSGELRFRQLKSDGTAYIRTEAPPDGGWQNAHYHKKVLETYIVQEGWIGYAEWISDALRLRVFKPGQSFTTAPLVIHNVYMPAGAVIHTVKHGDGKSEQRVEDDETRRFTALTKAIREADIVARAGLEAPGEAASPYSEAYRHFDNLIWQTAAWSSGIFALALAGLTQIGGDDPVGAHLGLGHDALLALFAAIFGAFIAIISHALYRFRWHQCRARQPRPAIRWRSPQFSLQCMVNLQAIMLFGVALLLIGVAPGRIAAALILVTVAAGGYQEGKVHGWLPKFGQRETRS
jgi:hypothetical protein